MVKRAELTIKEYVEGIKAGDITILSRAITLVESKNPDHQSIAKELITEILPLTGKSKRIGISGTPGVGKSTFIESFGLNLIKNKMKVAVLAIDPTSYKSGGSILGDKTRMNRLSSDPMAFIRPTPSGTNLGGIASKTRESLLLCEAAGFDVVIVETVGVGQSEVTVSKIVDFFFVLMQPGGGDDLQGIKRGILELADMVAINKADGDNLKNAKIAKTEYESALHILRQGEFWDPPVSLCSGLKNEGLDNIWSIILDYYEKMKAEDRLNNKRQEQLLKWLQELFFDKLSQSIKSNKDFDKNLKENFQDIIDHKISIIEAADKLFDKVMSNGN